MKERIKELQESIDDLEHELFITLPFKRSQAHVWAIVINGLMKERKK
jgi:hypothetical protein